MISKELLKVIDKNTSIKYKVVPKEEFDDKVVFWSQDYNQNTLLSLKLLIQKNIDIILCEDDELTKYRSDLYSNKDISDIESTLNLVSNNTYNSSIEENTNDENSAIIKSLNEIIDYAIDNKCSDIHFDANSKGSKVRIRRDGILENLLEVDSKAARLLVNRIKVISNLDYTIRNVPQDGRFTYKGIDFRVAIIPTAFSEKVVLRILDKQNVEFTMEGIGLRGNDLEKISNLIKQPNGLILVVGPTGSGKSSTIYTLLNEINSPQINIISVEDPVEYKIEGINQIEINEKVGLDFNAGLKSILRLDPDKIMVGEIRDSQTARTALRSSITGHLVMSTLHTNDSPSALYRLRDMGIENYLISAGVIGIISQRLVRKLCDCKKKENKYVDIVGKHMDVHSAVGCPKCNHTGYQGRIAVFEILILDDVLKDAINENIPLSQFRKLCKQQGMVSLKESLINLISDGTTSLEELYKNIVTIGEL